MDAGGTTMLHSNTSNNITDVDNESNPSQLHEGIKSDSFGLASAKATRLSQPQTEHAAAIQQYFPKSFPLLN